jgi:hypothetical protein
VPKTAASAQFFVIATVLAAGLAASLTQSAVARDSPSQSSDRSARKVFELALTSGRVVGAGDTVRVSQGDELELRWSSDKPVALHLHGYDIEIKVTPAAPAVMSFKANLPGRFPVSEHGQGSGRHRAVLYLEVHP